MINLILLISLLFQLVSSVDYDLSQPQSNLASGFSRTSPTSMFILSDSVSSPLYKSLNFAQSPSSYPRYLYIGFIDTSSNSATISTPKIDLPQSTGAITLTYLELIDNTPFFSASYYTSNYLEQYPNGATPYLEENAPYSADWATADTVIYTSILKVDSACKCSYEINFNGVIRSVWINDQKRGSWGYNDRSDAIVSGSKTYNGKILLYANPRLNIVSVFGRSLYINSFLIKNCVDLNGNSIATPTHKFYAIGSSIKTKEDYTFNLASTISCPSNANRCITSTRAISCNPGYLRDDDSCTRVCSSGFASHLSVCEQEVTLQSLNGNIVFNSDSLTGGTDKIENGGNKRIIVIALPGLYIDSNSRDMNIAPRDVLGKAVVNDCGLSFLNDCVVTLSTPIWKPGSFDVIAFELDETIGAVMRISEYGSGGVYVTSTFAAIDATLSLDSTKNYKITTFVQCTGCTVYLEATGKVAGLLDLNQKILNLNFGSSPTLFRIAIPTTELDDLRMLSFELSSSNFFKLHFSSNPVLVGIDLPIKFKTNIPFQPTNDDCSIYQGCLSCVSGDCLNCPMGLFGVSCEEDCTVGRNDISSGTCLASCLDNTTLALDTCFPSCPVGFFYSYPNGCTNECDLACTSCINATYCLTCAPGSYEATTGKCIRCPPGTFEDNSFCTNLGFYQSFFPIDVSYCEDVLVRSHMEDYLNVEITGSIEWYLYTGGNSSFRNFVASLTTNYIYIPKEWLEMNREYGFSAKYRYNGQDYYTSHFIQTSLSYDVILPAQANININLPYEITALLPTCRSTENLIYNWTSGDIDVTPWIQPSRPLTLSIPGCGFPYTLSYFLVLNVSSPPKGWISENIFVSTVDSNLFVNINPVSGGVIPVGEPLSLGSQVFYPGECPLSNLGEITYNWTCTKNDIPCNDPSSIFGQDVTSINIPANYFSINDIIFIEFSAITASKSSSSRISFEVADNTHILPKIFCSDERTCGKYVRSVQYDYYADIDPLANITWSVTPFVPFAFFQNHLRLLPNEFSLTESTLTISVTMSNSTYQGRGTFNLTIIEPPKSGVVFTNPPFGIALVTNFQIRTGAWQDSSDLPIKYSFVYTFDTEFIRILPPTFEMFIMSYLPGTVPNKKLKLAAYAIDAIGTQGLSQVLEMDVFTYLKTPLQAIERVNAILDTIQNSSLLTPPQIMKNLLIAQEELANQDVFNNNSCPSCSGNGYCQDQICICNEGWTKEDCSVSVSDANNLIDVKTKILAKVNLTYPLQETEPIYTEMTLRTLKTASESYYFNKNSTLQAIDEILEYTVKIYNSTEPINYSQAELIADTMDRMLNFTARSDCLIEYPFTESLEDKLYNYLESISQNLLLNKLPSESASVIVSYNFDLFLKSFSLCDIASLQINTSSEAPVVTLEVNVTEPNCFDIYNLQYYAFRPYIYACPDEDVSQRFLQMKNANQETKKTLIGIKITDPRTKTTPPFNFTAKLEMPSGVVCPKGCKNEGKLCFCESLDPFDVKGQIARIFFRSNFNLIGNINTLGNFPFYKTVVFAGMMFFSAWVLLTVYFTTNTGLKNLSIIEKWKQDPYKSHPKAFISSILIEHPILSVYYWIDPLLIKPVKATMYYTRSLLLLTYAMIFSPVTTDKNAAYVFSVYLILLPYITYIPIIIILSTLIKLNRTQSKDMTKGIKFRFYLGVFLTIICNVGCILIILIIAGQQTQAERTSFIINFGIAFASDIFVAPFITICMKISLYFAIQKVKLKLQTRKKVANFIGEEGMMKIYDDLLMNESLKYSYLPIEQALFFNLVKPGKINNKMISSSSLNEIIDLLDNSMSFVSVEKDADKNKSEHYSYSLDNVPKLSYEKLETLTKTFVQSKKDLK